MRGIWGPTRRSSCGPAQTGHVELRLGEGLAVSGRVVAAGGASVAGASVTLTVGTNLVPRQEWTGADGSFRFSGVTRGQLHLRAGKEGMGSAQRGDLALTDAPLAGVELLLVQGGTISGRVLGLADAELSRVRVWGQGERDHRVMPTVDFAGSYRVEGAAAGEWTMTAVVPGTGRWVSGKVELPDPGAEVTLDLEFTAGLTLAGRVLCAGRPLAGAVMEARSEQGDDGPRAATDWDGAFRLDGLKAGAYRLLVIKDSAGINYQDPERFELAVSRGDVTIEVPGQARVSGRVVEAGTQTPIADANIVFEPLDDGGGPFFPGHGLAGRSDAQGAFRANAPAGRYRVVATRTGYAPGEVTVDATTAAPPEVWIALTPDPG
jgi:hypothetical protein